MEQKVLKFTLFSKSKKVDKFNKINPFFIFCYTLVNMICLSDCNIWDNFFTQIKSPHFRIPDEFSLMLFKENANIMNISASYKYNSYKLSLFQNPLNSANTDLKFLQNNMNENSYNKTIVDIYVNFTGGIINLDFHDYCKYINATALSKFSSKFFLTSYELLTLFEQEELYYNYIFMNPLNNHILNSTIKSIRDNRNIFLNMNADKGKSLNKKFNELSKNNSVLNQLIEILKQLGIFDLSSKNKFSYDEDYQLLFKVDKKDENLKIISFIYKGFDLVDLNVKVLLEKKNQAFFLPQSENCTILTPNETIY